MHRIATFKGKRACHPFQTHYTCRLRGFFIPPFNPVEPSAIRYAAFNEQPRGKFNSVYLQSCNLAVMIKCQAHELILNTIWVHTYRNRWLTAGSLGFNGIKLLFFRFKTIDKAELTACIRFNNGCGNLPAMRIYEGKMLWGSRPQRQPDQPGGRMCLVLDRFCCDPTDIIQQAKIATGRLGHSFFKCGCGRIHCMLNQVARCPLTPQVHHRRRHAEVGGRENPEARFKRSIQKVLNGLRHFVLALQKAPCLKLHNTGAFQAGEQTVVGPFLSPTRKPVKAAIRRILTD